VTTVEDFRSAVTQPNSDVSIAGIPWPAYKLLALAVGLLVLVIVGVATTSAAPAILSAAAAATVVWLGLGIFHRAN
jgi:hypothetical protein